MASFVASKLFFGGTGGKLFAPSRSGEYDGSLSFVKSLSCDDLWAQSDELREYADNRLDMDDCRFVALDFVWGPTLAGGVGNCATGFRGMGPA